MIAKALAAMKHLSADSRGVVSACGMNTCDGLAEVLKGKGFADAGGCGNREVLTVKELALRRHGKPRYM